MAEGGSTITQQLAKSLIGRRRTLDRKLRELVLARRIEANFSKDDILRHYLDRAYFGRGTTGIEAAARTFFGKAARDLTLFEATALVGRLPAPSRAGTPHATAWPVLQAMVQAGALTQAQADAALAAGPRPGRLAPLAVDIRHYSSWVGRTMAAQGLDGRFRVAIDVDLRHQMAAQSGVAAAAARGALTTNQEVALVAITPDGRVSALVGGKHYGGSQFDRATLAERQPGSTVKPFTFLAALEAGWRPGMIIDDAPVSLGTWQPRNHDHRYLGEVPLTDALRRSRNAATVRLATEVGVETVAALFLRFGLQADTRRPAFLLGAEGGRLVDLAAAYAMLAAQGRPVAATSALIALRDGGPVVYRAPRPQAAPAAEAEAVAVLNAMLRLDSAPGLHGKSGTSQANRDALFAGFSTQATAAVWVGRDDAAPMPGVVGGGVSAEIWQGFLTALPGAR